ncbi:MAG: zinc ABC transporter substrate-binding protein [bacterium]|nr:zinc ABC transporter substrate-binding protein [bacterium]
MKKIVAFFVVALLLSVSLVLFAASKSKPVPKPALGKIIVTASFYPLAEFAKRIGGDYIDVVNITPAGVEAHDYEPTPRDIAAIRVSKVFLYQGAGFDPWAERVAQDLKGTDVKAVNITDQFDLKSVIGEGVTAKDPHVWLDPVLAQKEVLKIRDAIISVFPQYSDRFNQNADAFIVKLVALDTFIRKSLTGCALSDIIVSHQAFSYFSSRYGINETAISGISPEEEPSAQRLGEVAQLAKEKNIKTIFFETLASPKLAETVAKEAGLTTLVLNPLEGLIPEEISSGKDYLSVMADNVHNLQQALQCLNQ